MQNCVSIIGAPVTAIQLQSWSLVCDMQAVLGTQPIENLCIVRDELNADDLCFPGVCTRDVVAIIVHECSDAPTDMLMQYQIPPLGIWQDGDDLKLCLTGFCLSSADDCIDPTYPECDPCECPCDALKRLQCCYDDWLCGKRVSSAEWNGRILHYSNASMALLKERINELRALCDAKMCKPSRRYYRFRC